MLVERTACCHVGNVFLNRLELIWPISQLKISKMSKTCIFGRKFWESMGGIGPYGGLSIPLCVVTASCSLASLSSASYDTILQCSNRNNAAGFLHPLQAYMIGELHEPRAHRAI